MTTSSAKDTPYGGFEQGPIRPPSEAHSLLIRVTRNCPWNRCSFCPVYKHERFSIRPVDHVIRDIDAVHRHIEALQAQAGDGGHVPHGELRRRAQPQTPDDLQAFSAALNWYTAGMRSIFIQDANSLIVKPSDLLAILAHLRKRFGTVERITSYARSHTVARIADADLAAMRAEGLNRIHIGLESGSDAVLAMVAKGVTQETHVKAGRKVKQAGMQLSEYVMPGLGGRALSEAHARETAAALNRIDPDFIRLRTLALPNGLPLYDDWQAGRFEKLGDVAMAREILLLLQNLEGIHSRVVSDHVLNLFQEVEGQLPDDRERMTAVIEAFLALPPAERTVYQVGRRLGIFGTLADLQSASRRERAERTCRELGLTPENADEVIDELMKRFI